MRMKSFQISTLAIFLFITAAAVQAEKLATAVIIDHNCAQLSFIPDEWLEAAKTNLHIAYGHTSHGSQLTTGMSGLADWKGDKFAWNNGGTDGALDLHDRAFSGASDLGNPNRTAWAAATRDYLNKPENSDVNVVIWSWCGQVSSATESDIDTYLSLMTELETDFPSVEFVYMTGHLDGTGEEGNLHQRNEQIRNYCRTNEKILYDFADIESYDPDGNYYLDKMANDGCFYDSDDNGSLDKNWATDWQDSHTENVDWFNCSAAHSQPLNGNLKAYAAWWLWASLAGWESASALTPNREALPEKFELFQNYPNPFNPVTSITYSLASPGFTSIEFYDSSGKKVHTTHCGFNPVGQHKFHFDASGLSSGIYFYRLMVGNYISAAKKMVFLE